MIALLTVTELAANPGSGAKVVTTPSGAELVLRPLVADDESALAGFFAGLSVATRANYSVERDVDAQAAEHCAAIGRYDKVRLVLDSGRRRLVGLVELSLDVVADDVDRLAGYGVELGAGDARFGLCLADAQQGQGIASASMPLVCALARRLGKNRLLLWGGVYEHNRPARAFYRRVGFGELGEFTNSAGMRCLDGLLELR